MSVAGSNVQPQNSLVFDSLYPYREGATKKRNIYNEIYSGNHQFYRPKKILEVQWVNYRDWE